LVDPATIRSRVERLLTDREIHRRLAA
jgi:hypothetical protein